MTKILKKLTSGDLFLDDMGLTIPGSGQLTIDPNQYVLLQRSSDVITALSDGDLVFNDGSSDITNLAEAVNIIQGGTPQVDIKKEPPFASKTIDGVPLYNRTTGKKFSLIPGAQDCKFEIPFPLMKFNGIEIINGEAGDVVNLYVWDSTTGTYTTIPNYQLNQFGYAVAVAPGFYRRKSDYDADVQLDMQIVIEYDSVSGKDIWVNYDIHELKP